MADLTFNGTIQGLVGIIAQRPTEWKIAAKGLWVGLGYNAPRDPMSLIQATNLSKYYGGQDVFEDVSLTIPRQSHIALVGRNGVGKTTLFRILAGLETPDSGTVHRARSLEIAYLPQEISFSQSRRDELSSNIWDLCLTAFEDLLSKERKLAVLEEAMRDPHSLGAAMDQYGTLQETYEREGGYTYEARIQQVLSGLGFQRDEFNRPLEDLSGGERTRAQLARLLLEDPDLLILDEPTNHLDIEAIEWLEGWLADWPGSALVVSHDRYFLDNVVGAIWELTSTGLTTYRGNYSAYVQQRAERYAYRSQQYKAQQEFIRREQDYIQRNIAGQNAGQAQGRRKRLNRLLRDDAIQVEKKEHTARINFQPVDRSANIVLQTQNLVVAHPDLNEPLFSTPEIILRRGERAALIGPNGAGKTTFLRTLLGELAPLEGSVRLGEGLELGYFEQAHASLNTNNTILEEVLDADPTLKRSEARIFLAQLLFTGEEVDKSVAILSGGERGRLALAKLILEGSNFLLLDEPTNHLDLPSQESLEEALKHFPGTILLVSHDRYLVESLVDQIWSISPGDRALQVFHGGYSAYQAHKLEVDNEVQKKDEKPRSQKKSPQKKGSNVDLHNVEARITNLENALVELGQELEGAGERVEDVVEMGERYGALENELQLQLELWETLSRGTNEA